MSDSTPVIAVDGLVKRYGSATAVDGVTFEVRRGETFALLGPNGAGKSTTVEILEGYRLRSGGDVSVLGTDPATGGPEWKARIGIVLQSAGEAATVTVREQVSHFALMYPNAREVDEVLEAVGLTEKADARISRLSGGQKRRVDVALGIIGTPDVLFLDEPTTGFDPEARRQFWELIRSLQVEGTSIVLTTHYLDEAAQLADRVAIIAGGRLIDTGTVDGIGGAESRVPIVRWREEGRLREQRTDDPASLVVRLRAEGADLSALEVVRPSLEDVYLDLVERTEESAVSPGTATDPAREVTR